LLTINCSTVYKKVSTGSLVKCEGATFFIAAGLGKIIFEDEIIFMLSPAAPLAKTLFNKIEGEKILFNKKDLIIRNIS